MTQDHEVVMIPDIPPPVINNQGNEAVIENLPKEETHHLTLPGGKEVKAPLLEETNLAIEDPVVIVLDLDQEIGSQGIMKIINQKKRKKISIYLQEKNPLLPEVQERKVEEN